MKYNLYISNYSGSYNVFDIAEDKVAIAVLAYLEGKTKFTISGKAYYFDNVNEFKIYTFITDKEHIDYYLRNINFRIKNSYGTYLPPSTLEKMGQDVTDSFIGDKEYGAMATEEAIPAPIKQNVFVHASRIEELKCIQNPNFDFTKLIRFCEEINDNFTNGNYLSVAMLGRSIINHVPPVFGLKTFNEVCGQHGGKSFKNIMEHLNNSMKNIADSYLHETIRKSEILPNSNQVNFSQDLDVLLAEVVRISKTN